MSFGSATPTICMVKTIAPMRLPYLITVSEGLYLVRHKSFGKKKINLHAQADNVFDVMLAKAKLRKFEMFYLDVTVNAHKNLFVIHYEECFSPKTLRVLSVE